MGVLGEIKLKQLKNKNTIAYTTVEDISGTVDIIVFSAILASYRSIMTAGSVVIINGKVSEREDREPEIVCESVEIVPESAQNAEQIETLYLKISSINSQQFNEVCEILAKYKGSVQNGEYILVSKSHWLVNLYTIDENTICRFVVKHIIFPIHMSDACMIT